MFKLPKLSFHPKLAAAVDLIFGLACFWSLGIVWVWWALLIWFVVRLLFWALLVKLVYFPVRVERLHHWLALALFNFGMILFLIFMEWRPAFLLAEVLFVICPAISFWMLPTKDLDLSFWYKPYRRWIFLLATMGLAGVSSGLIAIYEFQLNSFSKWWLIIFGSIFSTAVAYWWWLEYGMEKNRRLWTWVVAWLLLMIEFFWMIFILPLGYLSSGILIIWLWYIGWLLVRYHLTSEGIVWKKHFLFLGINFFALLFFLIFFVRWQ